MARLVEEHFKGCGDVDVAHEIAEGPKLAELLRLIKNKDIDLVLTGRQVDDTAACALAEKLARKATCSVLVCPDDSEPKIARILVPIDFAEPSEDAVDVAVAFASASGTATITCLHIYDVPIGYGKLGISYEEFAETMKSHAVRHYDRFIRDQNLKGIEAVPVFRLDSHPAKAIARVAEEQGVDLVVMGARGRGAGAGVLLGSVTERLLHSIRVPLVAVKKKGYGMTVLDALLRL
jgi:nucleotide-binding universal stress UspA family protein